MGNTFEKNLLRFLVGFGIIAFANIFRKPPIKDWLIVFFLKAYIASFLDTIVVKKGYVRYPYTLLKSFNISVVFSYLIYPMTCVYFNKATRKSNLFGILITDFLFTTPMVIFETWLEKRTKLIKYKKGWDWKASFASIYGTFLIVRLMMLMINKFNNSGKQ